MTGIIVAMEEEAQGVINRLTDAKKTTIIKKPVYIGKLFGKDVVIALSNIGKINAAATTQSIIDKFGVDNIINFGTAGGIKNKVQPLKYYSVDKCCQYDFDLSTIDDVEIGHIQGFDSVYFTAKKDVFDFLPAANVASSDHFTESEKDINIVSDLDCTLFDMELGAIGQVCTLNCVPFAAVKGVTDVHGSGADGNTFAKNLKTVCDGFYDILEKALNK